MFFCSTTLGFETREGPITPHPYRLRCEKYLDRGGGELKKRSSKLSLNPDVPILANACAKP